MPVYDYSHSGSGCKLGKLFECFQPLNEEKLQQCPVCGQPVTRLISPVRSMLKTHVSDSTLKQHGFTKLVRKDTGVYENVTARQNEPRYVQIQS